MYVEICMKSFHIYTFAWDLFTFFTIGPLLWSEISIIFCSAQHRRLYSHHHLHTSVLLRAMMFLAPYIAPSNYCSNFLSTFQMKLHNLGYMKEILLFQLISASNSIKIVLPCSHLTNLSLFTHHTHANSERPKETVEAPVQRPSGVGEEPPPDTSLAPTLKKGTCGREQCVGCRQRDYNYTRPRSMLPIAT